MNTSNLITSLYQSVDEMNLNALASLLSNKVIFQLGNSHPLVGIDQFISANNTFFKRIKSMTHQIDTTCHNRDQIFCCGTVTYQRLDLSSLTVPFATLLKVYNEQISHYSVYVDLSEL